jgi:hypothetical protein
LSKGLRLLLPGPLVLVLPQGLVAPLLAALVVPVCHRRSPLSVPAVLAVAVAALRRLALLPAASNLLLLACHPGEVVVLPRLPVLAIRTPRLVLPFLALLALLGALLVVLDLAVGHRDSPS